MTDWQSKLKINRNGLLNGKIVHNYELMMRYHPEFAGVFGWDAETSAVMIMRRPPWDEQGYAYPRPLRDADYTHAMFQLETLGVGSKRPLVVHVINKLVPTWQ